MEEELLTVREAAGKYRVSEETIRRWIKSGFLKYIPVGPFKMKRIRPSDLTAKRAHEDKNGQ